MFAFFRRSILFLVGFSLPIQGSSVIDVGIQMTPFKLMSGFLLILAGAQFATSIALLFLPESVERRRNDGLWTS